MNRFAILAAQLALLTLAGCAREQVRDLGGGRHSITACSDAGLTNPQVQAVHAADHYCGKYGQAAVVQRFEPESCPGAAASAAIAAEFTCR
jgi:hypothetical protein